MALMFTLLPLYYSDNYYNILHDKRDVFHLFAEILLVVVAGSLLVGLFFAVKNKTIAQKAKQAVKQIRALDIVMAAFAIAAVISTYAGADYRQSMSGEAAWDVGTKAIIISALVYFVISRCYTGKKDIWVYLYLGSFAVLLIGVIDRLGYDFLVMHDEIPLQYNIFISTIGNVNFWAGYLSLIVPFFMVAPLFFKHVGSRFFTYIFLLVAYFSMFITLTNTTYIGIGIGALFVVWYSLRDVKRLKNLAANGILFSIAGAVAEFLWRKPCTPRPIDMDSVTSLLLKHRLYVVPGIIGIAILLIMLIIAVIPEKYKKKADGFVEKMVSRFWLLLILTGVIGVVFYLIYNYNLELFNYRGSIWYFAFHGYLDGTPWQKVMGVGPGLLDTVTQAQIAKADFEVVWNWFYCTAHNDLLEYLVTMGGVGFALKLLMYVLPFVMFAKKSTWQTEKAAVLAALVGYIGQGLFTGPYILTYVFYIIFLGVLCAYDRMGNEK